MLAWGLARLEAKPSPVFMTDLLSNSQQCLIALDARHAAQPEGLSLQQDTSTQLGLQQQRYPSQLPQQFRDSQNRPNSAASRGQSLTKLRGAGATIPREADFVQAGGSRTLLPWQERELQEQHNQQWQPIRERRSQGSRDEENSFLGAQTLVLAESRNWEAEHGQSLAGSSAGYIDFDSSSLVSVAGGREAESTEGADREYRITQELACLIWAIAQLLPDSVVSGAASAASLSMDITSPTEAASPPAASSPFPTTQASPALPALQACSAVMPPASAAGDIHSASIPPAIHTSTTPSGSAASTPSILPPTVLKPPSAASKRLARKRRTALIASYTPLTESATLAAHATALHAGAHQATPTHKPHVSSASTAPEARPSRSSPYPADTSPVIPVEHAPQGASQRGSEKHIPQQHAPHTSQPPQIVGRAAPAALTGEIPAVPPPQRVGRTAAASKTAISSFVSPLQDLKLLWFSHFESASLPLLHLCSPHELAVIAHSVGALGVRPGARWMESLLGTAAAEVVYDSYSPAHMALLLRGLSQVCHLFYSVMSSCFNIHDQNSDIKRFCGVFS